MGAFFVEHMRELTDGNLTEPEPQVLPSERTQEELVNGVIENSYDEIQSLKEVDYISEGDAILKLIKHLEDLRDRGIPDQELVPVADAINKLSGSYDEKSVSLESLGNSNFSVEVAVSMENSENVIKKIWKKVLGFFISMFKAIWNFIKSLFGKKKDNDKKLDEMVRKKEEEERKDKQKDFEEDLKRSREARQKKWDEERKERRRAERPEREARHNRFEDMKEQTHGLTEFDFTCPLFSMLNDDTDRFSYLTLKHLIVDSYESFNKFEGQSDEFSKYFITNIIKPLEEFLSEFKLDSIYKDQGFEALKRTLNNLKSTVMFTTRSSGGFSHSLTSREASNNIYVKNIKNSPIIDDNSVVSLWSDLTYGRIPYNLNFVRIIDKDKVSIKYYTTRDEFKKLENKTITIGYDRATELALIKDTIRARKKNTFSSLMKCSEKIESSVVKLLKDLEGGKKYEIDQLKTNVSDRLPTKARVISIMRYLVENKNQASKWIDQIENSREVKPESKTKAVEVINKISNGAVNGLNGSTITKDSIVSLYKIIESADISTQEINTTFIAISNTHPAGVDWNLDASANKLRSTDETFTSHSKEDVKAIDKEVDQLIRATLESAKFATKDLLGETLNVYQHFDDLVVNSLEMLSEQVEKQKYKRKEFVDED